MEATDELELSSGTIVTRRDQETTEEGSKTIGVVPAWRILLDESGGRDARRVRWRDRKILRRILCSP
jgi:hypothetical protein